LKALIDAAEKGEWEGIDELALRLKHALDAVHSPNQSMETQKAKREKIEQVLGLIESAISHCAIRKDQIAPLVNAFITNQNASDNP